MPRELFGTSLGALERLLVRSWSLLGRSWGALNFSWEALGTLLGHSGLLLDVPLKRIFQDVTHVTFLYAYLRASITFVSRTSQGFCNYFVTHISDFLEHFCNAPLRVSVTFCKAPLRVSVTFL